MAREAFGFDGGNDGRDIEDFRRLRQRNGVVFQHLAVNRLHAKGHLRLLVDENNLAVMWREDFKLSVGHAFTHRGYVTEFSPIGAEQKDGQCRFSLLLLAVWSQCRATGEGKLLSLRITIRRYRYPSV